MPAVWLQKEKEERALMMHAKKLLDADVETLSEFVSGYVLHKLRHQLEAAFELLRNKQGARNNREGGGK